MIISRHESRALAILRKHNETFPYEQAVKPEKLQERNKSKQKKPENRSHARGWSSLINDSDAWEQVNVPYRQEPKIDERDFFGTSPPFSWE